MRAIRSCDGRTHTDRPAGLPVVEAAAADAYRWLWGATLASNSARYAVLLIAGWLALQLTGSPLGPGTVFFLGLTPAVVIGPVAGVLADRIDRRRLIQEGAAVGGGASLLAAGAGAAHLLSFGVVLLLAAAAGAAQALEQPARMSLVSRAVKPHRLLSAFSLIRVADQGAGFVGPALVTGLLARYGPVPALGFSGLLYVLAGALAGRIAIRADRRPPHDGGGARDGAGLWDGIRTGFAYIVRERMISILTLFAGGQCALTMTFMGLLPSFARTVLLGGSATYGVLMAAVGLGAIAGPVALAGWARANERRLLVVTGLLSGLALIALGAARTLAASAAAAAAAGAGQSLFMVAIYSQTQALATDEMRGRVASVVLFLTSGIMGFFTLAMSAVATRVGPQAVLIASGAAFLAAAAGFLVRVPQLRWSVPLAFEERPTR